MRQRRVQRLKLEQPIGGRLDDQPVKVLNISLQGALMESSEQRRVGGTTIFLPWDDGSPGLECKVRRCELVRFGSFDHSTYQIAVDYSGASLESKSRLRQFLVDLLKGAIDDWKRNAAVGPDQQVESFPMFDVGVSEIMAELGSSTASKRVWHRLLDGEWVSTNVASTLQPLDGFCVTSDIDSEELTLLKESYEQSDATGRQFIRLLASVAASERS